MKANVDKDICIGCGLCEGTDPDVFRMDGDKAEVYADVDDIHKDKVQEAIDSCPVSAISWQ